MDSFVNSSLTYQPKSTKEHKELDYYEEPTHKSPHIYDRSHSELTISNEWVKAMQDPFSTESSKENVISDTNRSSRKTHQNGVNTKQSIGSTGKRKGFAYIWYPNSNHTSKSMQDQSCSSAYNKEVAQCKQEESLSTDGDISDINEDDDDGLGLHSELQARNSLRPGSQISAETNNSLYSEHESKGAKIQAQDAADFSKTTDHPNSSESLTPSKCNVGTLWKQFLAERQQRREAVLLLEKLQGNYDDLLQKYAEAENTIDTLRLSASLQQMNNPRRKSSDSNACNSFGHHQCKTSAVNSETSKVDSELRSSSSSLKVSKYRSCSSLMTGNLGIAPRNAFSSFAKSMPNLDKVTTQKEDCKESNFHRNSNANTKPSTQSIYLRANCLEDQMKLAYEATENDQMTQLAKEELLMHLKRNLKSLKKDCYKLQESENTQNLKKMLARLQSRFTILKSHPNSTQNSTQVMTERRDSFTTLNDRAMKNNESDNELLLQKAECLSEEHSVRPLMLSTRPQQQIKENSTDVLSAQISEHEENWTLFSGFGQKITAKLNVRDCSHISMGNECGQHQDTANSRSSADVHARRHQYVSCLSEERDVTYAPKEKNKTLVAKIHNPVSNKTNTVTDSTKQMCSSRTNSRKLKPPLNKKGVTDTKNNTSFTQHLGKNDAKLNFLSSLLSAERRATYLHKKSVKILTSLCKENDSTKFDLYY